VVSTPITDVVRPYGDKGLVEIAKTPLEVVRKVELLLARPKEAWLQKVDRHLASGSWDKTWGAMQKLIASGMGGSGAIGGVDRPVAGSLPTYATTPAE
jgi:hypothetical protein